MGIILGDSLLRNDKSLEAALSNKIDKTTTNDQEISSGLVLPNNKNINSYDNNNNISRIAQINLDKLEFGSNTIQTNIYSLNRPKVFTKINSTITENEVAYKSEIDKLPITLKSTFLPLAGGIMTGAITIPNNIGIETKNTSGTNINLIRMSDLNTFEIGSSGSIGVVLTNGEFRPFRAKSGQLNLGNSSIKWKDLYLTGTANANTVSATNLNGTTIKQNNKVVANQEDLTNEITNRQTAITNLQNSVASTYLPLAGGTLSGNLKVSNKLSFTDIANPNVELQSGTNKYYLQAYQNQIGIGPGWDKATKWDSNGNVTISKTLNVTGTFQIGGKAITYDAATDTFII